MTFNVSELPQSTAFTKRLDDVELAFSELSTAYINQTEIIKNILEQFQKIVNAQTEILTILSQKNL